MSQEQRNITPESRAQTAVTGRINNGNEQELHGKQFNQCICAKSKPILYLTYTDIKKDQ